MPLDPDDLGTIVGVWAHPDDEAFLSAALMAAAADAGRRVVCVTATRGEAGFPDDDPRSPDERAGIRTREAAACLEALGVSEHHWLGYPDGGCHLVDPAEPVAKLATLLDEIRPDTVLTFGPDGMTGHDDHVAVSWWTTLAVRQAALPGRLLYATKTAEANAHFSSYIDLDQIMMVDGMQPPAVEPDDLAVWLRPTGPLLDVKVRALLAQASQIAGLHGLVGDAAFRELVADEFFRHAGPTDWPAAG